jgi:hypothetical protein
MEKTIPTLTPAKIAEMNEFGELEAQANFMQCAPREFVESFRMEIKRIGPAVVGMIPELDTPFFNRILGLGVGSPATESMLDEGLAVFEKAGCKNYMVQLSPLAQPAEIPEWLLARGITPSRNWAKMYRGNDPAPVILTDLRVEKIGVNQADAFASVVLSAFEMPAVLRPLMKGPVGQPGWQHYMAFDGEKPVSVASIYIKDEIGWLGNAGTLKKYRKRGCQGAMFSHRIQDGLELGCKWFVTETGEDTPKDPNPSYHNMLRSGFQLAYLRRNYVHMAPAKPLHINEWSRALFVAAYTLKFEWYRLRSR